MLRKHGTGDGRILRDPEEPEDEPQNEGESEED